MLFLDAAQIDSSLKLELIAPTMAPAASSVSSQIVEGYRGPVAGHLRVLQRDFKDWETTLETRQQQLNEADRPLCVCGAWTDYGETVGGGQWRDRGGDRDLRASSS